MAFNRSLLLTYNLLCCLAPTQAVLCVHCKIESFNKTYFTNLIKQVAMCIRIYLPSVPEHLTPASSL